MTANPGQGNRKLAGGPRFVVAGTGADPTKRVPPAGRPDVEFAIALPAALSLTVRRRARNLPVLPGGAVEPRVSHSVRLPVADRSGYRRAARVIWIGVAVTAAQAVAKIVAGILAHSTALTADGLENVADLGVAAATVIGLRIASRPADLRHPYGHGKAEVLTAAVIAWVIVIMAMGMAARAIGQIVRPGQPVVPDWWALLFLGGTCAVGEGLYRYKTWQADKLMSVALRASAYDHRKDVLASFVALLAVGGAVTFGGRMAVLDPIGGLITCGFIGWMALRILRECTPHLMDEAVSGPLLDEIRRLAGQVDGVLGTEKLIARRSGLNVLVELHVEVDPQTTVARAHEVATAVRDCMVGRIDSISDVLVHVEPFYPDDHVNPPADPPSPEP